MDGDRQPIFNAPWPAVLLTVVILTVYGVQSFLPAEQILPRWAFSAQALEQGRYVTLFSALFLSGGWGHALANGVGALAFGTPLARLFGGKFAGASAFFLFCLVCGALSNLGFALVHPGSVGLLVGASGSVSALMAAASRIIAGRGGLGPILSAPVIGMGIAWLVVNLIVAVVGFAPGMGDAPVAWEAHLFGFAAGAILAGPFAWLARRDISD